MEANAETKVGGRLEAQKRLGKMIGEHYSRAHQIKESKSQPIAWVSTGAPNEILWSMGFYVMFPEAYAATCGARHAAHGHCEITEAHGYERHLCTYCRNSIGSSIAQIEGLEAFQPLPSPDFLLVANNSCILITKWWEHLSHYWNIPLINIDSPHLVPEMEEAAVVGHIERQCKDLIAFCEEFTGNKFDYDRFAEVVANARKSADGYRSIIEVNRHDPAPATYFDLMAHNFPNLVFRHTPEAAEHYRLMKEELDQRVEENVVPFENMKHRVYWDGVPYWFAMRFLSQKLQSLGICLVTSAYSEVFAFDRSDPARPLQSTAENVAHFYLNRSVESKARFTEKMFVDFALEGGIFAYAMTCKPFSITMHYIADHIREKLGVESTIIEGDLVDDTFFDEEKSGIRLEAFAESLDSRKAG